MLINLSSKKNSDWDENQKTISISKYESIVDIEIPSLSTKLDENGINEIVLEVIEKCKDYFCNVDLYNAVCVYGDSYFTYIFVNEMLARGYKCIHPTYDTIENENMFVKYIEYKHI